MSIKKKLLYIIMIAIHIIIMIMLCSQKSDFHMDELMTYGLSNSNAGIYPQIESNIRYEEWGPFENYLMVNEGEQFNYVNVWKNQADDVHPVLYYILVHTICSFFPNTFSMWYGLAVNLICLVFVDILLFKIANIIFKDEKSAVMLVALYGISVMLINMMSFIRMYILFTIFTLLLSLIYLEYFDKKKDKKFYLSVFFTVLGGMLTQYFFVIFLFFASVFMVIKLLFIDKDIKTTIRYCCCVIMGMLGSIAIFPWMLKHIFGGYRGKEAAQNLFSFSDIIDRLHSYFKMINSQLAYSLIIVFGVILFVYLVLKIKNGKLVFNANVMLITSAVLYVAVISKITTVISVRYIMPVCWIIFLYLIYVANSFTKNFKGIFAYSTFIIAAILSIFTLYKKDFSTSQMYKDTNAMKIASEYKDCEVICVGNSQWRCLYSAYTLLNYKGYYFIKKDGIDSFLNEHQDKMIIYLEDDIKGQDTLDIIEKYGKLTSLGKNFSTEIYYYEK